MKRFITLFIIFIMLIPTVTFAHSGKTDGAGGHYDTLTGEYHYHHGKSAHQHIDGICPYEKKFKIDVDKIEYILLGSTIFIGIICGIMSKIEEKTN